MRRQESNQQRDVTRERRETRETRRERYLLLLVGRQVVLGGYHAQGRSEEAVVAHEHRRDASDTIERVGRLGGGGLGLGGFGLGHAACCVLCCV